MPHPRHDLDPAFATPVRLSLMAALNADEEIEFGAIRDLLETSDSVVSKAIATLEDTGYVKTRRGSVGRRPRVWVRPTGRGSAAYARHLAALRAIAGL